MDTILNLGPNDDTAVTSCIILTNDLHGCYRRFLQCIIRRNGSSQRSDEDEEPFEVAIEDLKKELFPKEKGEVDDNLIDGGHERVGCPLQETIKERTGKEFPADPWEQLKGRSAQCSVLDERPRHRLSPQTWYPVEWGTAVNVCDGVGTGEKLVQVQPSLAILPLRKVQAANS